jgi:hypothetical protein
MKPVSVLDVSHPDAEGDVALLRTIAILEETLEEANILQADFGAIVARPRTMQP